MYVQFNILELVFLSIADSDIFKTLYAIPNRYKLNNKFLAI